MTTAWSATPDGGGAGLGGDGAGHHAGGAASLASGAAPPAADAGLLADEDAAADLGRAMVLLTAFRYRRGGDETAPEIEPDALTRALNAGIAHVARLRWRALAPVRRASGWADAARQEWTRLTSEAPWKR